MSRKRRKKKSRRPSTGSSSAYRRGVRQADKILARNGIKVLPANWRQLVLDWLTVEEQDRRELARYINAHEQRLGIAWAREILRLQVFNQVEDHLQIVDHYNRALARYPRCPLVEMWVADSLFRHLGDFWQARRMYQYAAEHYPVHPKPCYELGFMSYLLGDFPGALDWFDRAASRVADDDVEVGARVFYNRGISSPVTFTRHN